MAISSVITVVLFQVREYLNYYWKISSLYNSDLFQMSKFKEIIKDGKVQKLVSLLC
jgi:hypothetical protein